MVQLAWVTALKYLISLRPKSLLSSEDVKITCIYVSLIKRYWQRQVIHEEQIEVALEAVPLAYIEMVAMKTHTTANHAAIRLITL